MQFDMISRNKIPSHLTVPLLLALMVFALLTLTAGNYGIFTDGLYFYACALHPGLGMNTKLSMLVFALGLFAGFLLTTKQNLFRTRHPYVDGPKKVKRIYVCHNPARPLPLMWERFKTYM